MTIQIAEKKESTKNSDEVIKLNLDNYDLGSLTLPSLEVLKENNQKTKSIFSKPDPITNEVKILSAQVLKNPDAPKVAIIDSSEILIISQKVVTEKKDFLTEVTTSHLGSVANVTADQGLKIEKIYDVNSETGKNCDLKKIKDSLRDIIDSKVELHAINLSLSTQVSFKDLNSRIEKAKLSNIPNEQIDKNNIHKYSEVINELLRREYEISKNDSDKNLLEVINLLKELSEKEIAICMSSGNKGEEYFNLFSAAVPDTITVGGTTGLTENAKDLNKSSSNNSLNDTLQPFTFSKGFENGGLIYFQGTSYSAPLALLEVATMRQEGIRVKEINRILRTRLSESYMESPNNIIIRDACSSLPLLMNIQKLTEQKNGQTNKIDAAILNSLGLFTQTQMHSINTGFELNLSINELKEVLIALNTQTNIHILPIDKFKEVLNVYKNLEENKRSDFIDGLSKASNKATLSSLSDFLKKYK